MEAIRDRDIEDPNAPPPDILEILGDGQTQSETCGHCSRGFRWRVWRITCGRCSRLTKNASAFEGCPDCGGEETAAASVAEHHRLAHPEKRT